MQWRRENAKRWKWLGGFAERLAHAQAKGEPVHNRRKEKNTKNKRNGAAEIVNDDTKRDEVCTCKGKLPAPEDFEPAQHLKSHWTVRTVFCVFLAGLAELHVGLHARQARAASGTANEGLGHDPPGKVERRLFAWDNAATASDHECFG